MTDIDKVATSVTVSGTVKRPKCPIHKKAMKFRPGELRWVCPDPSCVAKLYPVIEQTIGKPVVGGGDLDIVVVKNSNHEETVFLRSRDTNILLDITEAVGFVRTKYPGTTDERRQYTIEYLPVALVIDTSKG